MLNKIAIMGRLTRDPEIRHTESGKAVANFTLAVDRDHNRNETDFIDVVAWNGTAEFVSKYFRKGSSICITGSIQNRTWTDQQGTKRYATDIVADEVMFVDSRQDSSNAASGAYTPDAYSTPSFSTPAASAPKFEEIKTDDDLPF